MIFDGILVDEQMRQARTKGQRVGSFLLLLLATLDPLEVAFWYESLCSMPPLAQGLLFSIILILLRRIVIVQQRGDDPAGSDDLGGSLEADKGAL